MAIFFAPSLGLVAFALLMWITLPTQLLDQLDKVQSRKRGIPDDHVQKARIWLADATIYFFTVGIIFLIETVVDLGTPILGSLTPKGYPSPAIYSDFFFVFGLIVLAYALFRTHQVIYFVLYPTSVVRITKFGIEFGQRAKFIMNLITLAFCVVNSLLAIGFLIAVPLNEFTSSLIIIEVSLVPSVPNLALTILSMRSKKLSRSNLIPPLVAMMPYFVAFLMNLKLL